MKSPKAPVRGEIAGQSSDSRHQPLVQKTFPMRLRAGYDLGKLSALEAEMDVEASLELSRRLMDEHRKSR